MLKPKQYFCKHDYKFLAKERDTMQNLWKCNKCGVYYIQHWGIGTGGKIKEPPPLNWIYE